MGTLKILHVANFSLLRPGEVFYTTDRRLSHGLAQLGHYVYEFSYRDVARIEAPLRMRRFGEGAMNRALLECVERFEPDLVLWGHCESVRPATLQAVRQRHARLPMAMWYVDTLPPKRRHKVADKLPWLDAAFLTTAGPTLTELRAFGDATLAYLPNVCAAAIDRGRAFDVATHEADLCYIGSNTPERTALLEGIARALPALRVAHRGHSAATRLVGQDYLDLIGHSAMGLNYSRPNDVSLYSSDRLIHLLANGTMVLTPAIPDLEQLFADDELVRFGTEAELHEQLRHYLAHPDERRAIAAKGHARAHASYNATRCARFLLEVTLGLPLSEDYEWRAHVHRARPVAGVA
jgi:Glycosyl transferases group 1